MNAPTVEIGTDADQKELDDSGKAVFDGIYDAPDPRLYYHAMASLDYRIPELAKPYFVDMFDRYRRARDRTALNIIDLGASYGVNAALLKWDLSLEQLFGRYTDPDSRSVETMELLNKDRAFFQQKAGQPGLHITGFDISERALHYALQAGIIDDAVSANLEEREPAAAEAAILSQADGMISSGCIGYVSETTLLRIIDTCGSNRPWMTHCVLRMFPLEPLEQALQSRGYRIGHEAHLVPQRRFVSSDEQASVIARLHELGIDPGGFESEGWLYATVVTATPE